MLQKKCNKLRDDETLSQALLCYKTRGSCYTSEILLQFSSYNS